MRILAVPMLVATAGLAAAAVGQIAVFDDRAAFLAATSGASATGPIPDLGAVVTKPNPTGATSVGSVVISLAPGGDSLAIGGAGVATLPAGEWYPESPGNDIALGWENLMLETTAPVYALGFDLWEPNATMPSWGGVPDDSTFEVTLYSAGVQVGQFQFNPPDDVEAFAGVWSAVAFDTVTVIDITLNDDDEYFGEVYTGDTPMPVVCYPDCNGDGALNLADFGCFQTNFALGDPYADCNADGVLNLADFGCFTTTFALGCP
ncbi:MAG: EF-hand domain-containing protein [Phycisphaerales bacterium]|nr:EF-hand domain-containing protein [Phycisphaerales bacterium]